MNDGKGAGSARVRRRHAAGNVLTLRRRLTMTQSEFIETYLSESGKPLISVATLSNLERGASLNIDKIVEKLSRSMDVSHDVFGLDPDAFAKNVALFFSRQLAQNSERRLANESEKRRFSLMELLVRSLCDYLIDAVMAGDLKTGDALPSDRQLSDMFHVGRTPLREALKVLDVLGIIQTLPSKGTYLSSRSTDLFFAPLSWSFLLGQSNTRQIVDVRNVLEAESARLAADNRETEAFRGLAAVFEKMRIAYEQANYRQFLDVDMDFHLAIAECSGNPVIINLLNTSRNLLAYISRSGLSTVATVDSVYREHVAIFTAIDKADAEAAGKAMAAHLGKARDRYTIHDTASLRPGSSALPRQS